MIDLNFYHENGFAILSDYFSSQEINNLSQEADRLIAKPSTRRILIDNEGDVKLVMAPSFDSEIFAALYQDERLLEIGAKILKDKFYLYQEKINPKKPFSMSQWNWHQDSYAWCKSDGMQTPQAVNIAILLDECNEFNGPTIFVPKSHKQGMIEHLYERIPTPPYNKIVLPEKKVIEMAKQNGLVSAKGPAGTVVVFDASLYHSSNVNISPFNRRMLFISYVANKVTFSPVAKPRELWLANRNNELNLPILGG